MGYGSMSAGDIPNGWVNSNNNVWYSQSAGSSSLPWGVTYPNWGDVTWTNDTTTAPITITPGITIYPQPVEPQQLEIDWETVRRNMEQQARVGLNPPPPVQKKVVPRKPLRMIRLREDAKKS